MNLHPPTVLSPQLARALIRSLSRGTAISSGVRHIHVGHARWMAAQDELLEEIAEDGHSDTKFVRGAYGAGKSHFLSVVQDHARRRGWMTSHIECKVDGVQIDRFETLYPKIVAKLLAPNVSQPSNDWEPAADPLRFLLDAWTRVLLRQAGVMDRNRTLDADMRIYNELQTGLLRRSLPPDFTKSLAVYARASIVNDFESMNTVAAWLGGAGHRVRLPRQYLVARVGAGASNHGTVELQPIGKGTAAEIMRGILYLVKSAGYAGLVLCIDEVEELAKLGTRRRQDQALQALREFVDNAGGDAGYRHLLMYLAATPEMFVSENYFPRYDALATRIQPLGDQINWRAPVIDLDRTPLSAAEMTGMAVRIRSVHAVAYGTADGDAMSDQRIGAFVEAVLASRYRVAKPRLLTRLIVDELERARQSGPGYSPAANLEDLLEGTAYRLSDAP